MQKRILKTFSLSLLIFISACISTNNVYKKKIKNLDALYAKERALFNAGKYNESLELVKNFPWHIDLHQKRKVKKITNLKLKILKLLSNNIDYIDTSIGSYQRHLYTNKSLLFSDINRAIFSSNTNDLKKIASKISGKSNYWYGNICFEIANRSFDKGDLDNAEDYLENVEVIRNHPLKIKAKVLLGYIKKAKQLHPFTIGVALQLDSEHKFYSDRILNGIQLAVGTFNNKANLPIKLAIVDVSGEKDLIKQRLLKLIANEKIIAVIGPSSSKKSKIVANILQSFAIPSLSLSQDGTVSEIGDYVYNISMTVEEQVKTLVNYAVNRAYIKKFAVLYPMDNYGKHLTELFFNEVKKQGASIQSVSSYDDNAVDFRAPVKKLLSLFYLIPRKPEFTELKDAYKEKYNRDPQYSDIDLPAIVDFEAVFIPDGAKTVSMIAPFFSLYDANVTLLGLNSWHNSTFIKRGSHYINGSIFVDGFSNNSNSSFARNFYKTFNRKPSVLEAQSYDAANIIMTFLKMRRDSATRSSLNDYISNLRNFYGTMGNLDIVGNGVAHRKLDVYKAYSSHFKKLSL